MMKYFSLLAAWLLLCGAVLAENPASGLAPGQWTAERARAWYAAQPWLVGCNFLPSTAVNDIEMWQADTFDVATIERELGWARELGFNSVRVFLNYVVWEADAAGLNERFQRFLEIAARQGISVMPVLLDDCNFAGREAKAGPQPDPVPGVHNSQWVSSPPLRMVTQRGDWAQLERYVKELIGTFGQDRRVVAWDLYNEPGNSGMGQRSLPLVEAAFAWARETNPDQPLTVGVWTDFDGEMSRRMFALSDVVSFHAYDDPQGVRHKIALCDEFERPVLCTEWLRRQTGNTFENLLPVFDEHHVGCYHWGLVAGRTQTYYPWGSAQDAPEPAQWQHDLFRGDGSPFSQTEWSFIKAYFGRLLAVVTEVVPTARREAVTWRYTLDDPGEGWSEPGFNDTAWREGAAPFGKLEPGIGRVPRTEWTSNSIWLRRVFTLPADRLDELWLTMHFDEDPEVYVNGILAAAPEKWSDRYQEIAISPAARASLNEGHNTLAVRCRQTWGGQFIDVGIGSRQTVPEQADEGGGRWSADRAWRWYDAQAWPCGFNYVPANAISYTEMWMDYAFDPVLIERELELAHEVGFNCIRVVLPFVVWEAEPAAFNKRLATLLEICGRHGIRVMPTLFDDCVFGSIRDPVFGRQPAVVEGWYANGWTPSPGHSLVRDAATWSRLEKYVKDVVATFKDNPQVWIWDLYNEPTNGGLGDVSLPLVERVFEWAREVNPSQPLTVGQWNGNARLNEIIYRHSDVITFHDYGGAEHLASHIADLQRQGRPLVCTEWLNRGRGSIVADCLPIFRRRTVGCMHWGLVNGKTQTHLNWGHRPGEPDPPVWQHDLFRSDHTPYEPSEIALFRRMIGMW
jgi:hypothetical protein